MNLFNLMLTRSSMSDEEAMALVGIILIVFGIIYLIALVWGVIVHIVSSIPYFNMARKAGFTHAWLSFIPYGQFYVITTLSHREFNIFNKFRTMNRKKAFWIYMIFVAVSVVINMTNSFFDGISEGLSAMAESSNEVSVSMVALIGMLLIILLSLIILVVSLAVAFASYVMRWRMYYDLLMTYGMEQHAMWASIVSLFVPLVIIVFSFIIMNKEPDYGFGNYYLNKFEA